MPPKTKRRDYGSGSVYQRASDGRWVGAAQAGWTAAGTRRRVTVSATTEAEAKRKLRKKIAEIELHGAPAEGTGAVTTVKSWADAWLPRHVTRVRPSTARTDTGAVRKWIIPTIGTRRLDALTPTDVRKLRAAITDAGRTTTTARHAHSVLMKMLKAAILEGHTVPQRVLLVEVPPVAKNDRDAIPLDQALAILRVAAERPDSARWVAALLQGMRQGECLGLTWDRVDLDAHVIDIPWQLDTLPYADRTRETFRVPDGMDVRHLEGAWHLTPVKSAHGQRIVPLVPWMSAALQQWRTEAPASPHGLVWPRPDGRPRDDKEDREAWWALQEAAGVRHPSGRWYTLHEARHTTATLLLEAGIDGKTAQAIMGHSSITTTRGYQHVSQTLARRALEDVAAKLNLTLPGVDPVHALPAGG